ncbi:ATP-binding protein [Streptomyces ferrugineus]|uniref:ATP-binding protein n=1 Tax=Streptomyces ferrugineus TaxID=1413221 RepID=A0A7M2SA53_9ACTN|nr:ATP-binding protein [Streptomyces ferrugineus]
MEQDLTSKEQRLLRSVSEAQEMFLAPPVPLWPQDCFAWRRLAATLSKPPDLADCAPHGTKVTENDKRLLYHGHMGTVITPAITRALRVVAQQVMSNRQRTDGKIGITVDGPRGTGKSALLQWIGVHWERRLAELYGPDENRIPVIPLSVPPPVRGNVRNWAGAFARFLGQERESGDPTESVIRAMRNARTLLVLIDGIERLRTAVDAELTFQYLDVIGEETGATFIYCGRGARSIVDPFIRDNDTPLERDEQPWGDHPVLQTSRIGFSDEEMRTFATIVDRFDKHLRLYRHTRGDLLELSQELHKRSRGYMRALSHLICQAAQKAIRSGEERITKDLLDTIQVGGVVRL